MNVFAQLREDGSIAQIAEGFQTAPFENAVQVPEHVAANIARVPEDWQFVGGTFVHIPRERKMVELVTENVHDLKVRMDDMQRQMAQKDRDIAGLLLEVARLKGGTSNV